RGGLPARGLRVVRGPPRGGAGGLGSGAGPIPVLRAGGAAARPGGDGPRPVRRRRAGPPRGPPRSTARGPRGAPPLGRGAVAPGAVRGARPAVRSQLGDLEPAGLAPVRRCPRGAP